MLDKDINDFADSLRVGLFAECANMGEAMKYAYNLIETLPQEFKAGAYTGLHVVLNTVAADLKRLTKESDDE